MDQDCEVIYLSYSGWSTYNTCPLQYKFKYVDNFPSLSDPRSSLFGKAFGRVFELFYAQEIWKHSDPVSELKKVVFDSIKYAFEDNKFVPDRNNDEDISFCKKLKLEIDNLIPHAINIIRKYKLLSETTKVEFKLDTTYKSNKHDFAVKMGGRADFIHGIHNPWIMDGKCGSKECIDNFQLIWYATQHYLRFHVAPARLGYIFWKYIDDPIMWVDYEEHDIKYCVKQVYQHANSIKLKMFDPKPSPSCRLCGYKDRCEKGRDFIKSMPVDSKTRVSTTESIFQIDDM